MLRQNEPGSSFERPWSQWLSQNNRYKKQIFANGLVQLISLCMICHFFCQQLQFLFELPARLKKCIEMKAYSQAVR